MADSEKLTALKKAYAEIILNTAKEAAARIMVAERKAERYRRELVAAKDEALRLLLRLKHLLDSKASEAAMTSVIQCKRIEELEAQLGEAEDIVKDLRAELRELQDELEEVTNHESLLPAEQTSPVQIAAEVSEENRLSTAEVSVENCFSTSGSILSSQSTDHCEPVFSLEMTNSIPSGLCNDNNCCSFQNPDFASVVIRRKEPELYRNGCTHRVCASERSLYGGSLSLLEKANGAKNCNDAGNCECDLDRKLASATAEFCGIKKGADDKNVVEAVTNCIHASCLNTLCRNEKGVSRYKDHKAPSAKTRVNISVDHNVQSGEDLTRMDYKPHQSSESSMAQDNKQDIEMMRMSPANSDPKETDEHEVLATHPTNKFLKYTFQRKRKRKLNSSPDGGHFHKNSIVKRLMEEKKCASQESQKSNLELESSEDKSRLAEVARQLMFLSEKEREELT